MNSLSWLIYWIGMVDGVNSFAEWLAIPGTISLVIVLIYWIFINGAAVSNMPHSEPQKKQFEVIWHWWSVGKNIALTIWLVGWFLIIVVPSRQTLLLIAGSQMSETILKSDAVQTVVNPGIDLLKTWIATETAKLKAPASKQ